MFSKIKLNEFDLTNVRVDKYQLPKIVTISPKFLYKYLVLRAKRNQCWWYIQDGDSVSCMQMYKFVCVFVCLRPSTVKASSWLEFQGTDQQCCVEGVCFPCQVALSLL